MAKNVYWNGKLIPASEWDYNLKRPKAAVQKPKKSKPVEVEVVVEEPKVIEVVLDEPIAELSEIDKLKLENL